MARRDALALLGYALLCLVLGATGTLMLAGDHVPLPPPLPIALLAVGVGVLLAAVITSVTLWTWWRRGGEQLLVRDILRTGRLPAGVEDEALHEMIRRRADSLLGRRWAWPLLAALQAAISVSHIVETGSDVYARAFWAMTAAVWVGSGAVLCWTAWRDRPRAIRLLNELNVRMGRPTGTT